MYEDTVLIKLRRDYEKDEVVMYALNKLKEKDIEIGILKSEIHELQDNPINLDNLKTIDDLKNKIEKIKLRQNLIKEKTNPDRKTIKQLNIDNNSLRSRNRHLESVNHKMHQKLYAILVNPENFNHKSLQDKMDFLNVFKPELIKE